MICVQCKDHIELGHWIFQVLNCIRQNREVSLIQALRCLFVWGIDETIIHSPPLFLIWFFIRLRSRKSWTLLSHLKNSPAKRQSGKNYFDDGFACGQSSRSKNKFHWIELMIISLFQYPCLSVLSSTTMHKQPKDTLLVIWVFICLFPANGIE